jgi:hypothetical protein
MYDWWVRNQDKTLASIALGSIIMLVVVKVQVAVPELLHGVKWAIWIPLFQSTEFQDVLGDLLSGIISAYIFYLLIDFLPRVSKERASKDYLGRLISSHVQTYLKGDITSRDRSLMEFKPLRGDELDQCQDLLSSAPEVRNLLAMAYLTVWSHQKMVDSLQLVAPFGVTHIEVWIEMTSCISKIKYLTEKAEESDFLRKMRAMVDSLGEPVFDMQVYDDETRWASLMQKEIGVLIDLAKRWKALNI